MYEDTILLLIPISTFVKFAKKTFVNSNQTREKYLRPEKKEQHQHFPFHFSFCH